MRTLTGFLLLSLSMPAAVVAQTVYKCAGADGAIVYSQSPCSTDPARVETIETTGVESAGTRDALAEQSEFVRMNDVRRRCDEQIRSIEGNYAAQYRSISDEIARVEEQIRSVDYRIRGSKYDTDLRSQIPTLEQQRASLQDNEAGSLSTTRARCQTDVEAEESRQAAARAERARAKEEADKAAAAKAAAEKAAAERAAAEKAKKDLEAELPPR